MTFCIITHVVHTKNHDSFYGYAPYINEMNLWLKHVDKVVIVAPLKKYETTAIHQKYNHNAIEFLEVPEFSLTSFKAILKTILQLPVLVFTIFKAMKSANHIHLRCPGNMGLLGSLVQILFPNKSKTAKYAGNWDANSKQPISYKLQKMILSNTFLTKKMQVLVYGEWKNQTKNIKSFFTATYSDSEKTEVPSKSLNHTIKFLFVGSLTKGKQPIYAIKIVENLKQFGHNVKLSIYGTGKEENSLLNYIEDKNLHEFVFLKGNIDKDAIKLIYQESHFLLLPSKSEGWPKVVAEAMFWNCLPIASKVSCIPNMLDFGSRGILLENDLEIDVNAVSELIGNEKLYNAKTNAALNWSRNFTIDKFESEIKKLVTS